MIKELIQFTESISDLKNIGIKPKEGLYIMLTLTKTEGHITIDENKYVAEVYSKKTGVGESAFLKKCAEIVQNTWMVDTNKCFDLPLKAIHSCSPYCLAFKREHLDTAPTEIIEKRTKVFEEKFINSFITELKEKENNNFDPKLVIEKKIENCKNETAPKKAQEFKKSLLEVGKKFKNNETGKKSQIYDRLNTYFEKAFKLLIEPEISNSNDYLMNAFQPASVTQGSEKGKLEVFKNALNSKEKLNNFLQSIDEYGDLIDSDYIVIFLDEPMSKINDAHKQYLKDKLFNTDEYNHIKKNEADEITEIYGTSDFFNGYPTKKIFLSHKTATFNVSNRISSKDAQELFDFKSVMSRKILPNPLPIFIYDEEKVIALPLLKQNAILEPEKRIGYQEILKDIQNSINREAGNYYLLNYNGGEVKDFDFVSRFEYDLKNDKGEIESWIVEPLFSKHFQPILNNIFEVQSKLLPAMFNNYLVVNTKLKTQQFKYFDELDPEYCETPNTYLLVMKYRKGFYDFIYKSQRKSITQKGFEEIMLTLIVDDIKRDKFEQGYNSKKRNILEKLNILFSLHSKFQPFIKNDLFMANQTVKLREFVSKLATGEGIIETDDQFAFTAGQVIAYLYFKSKSTDRSYSRLERFLNQSDSEKFNEAVYDLFMRYKHEKFSKKFRLPFSEVTGYTKIQQMRKLMPLILSGFFSPNLLWADKNSEPDVANSEEEIKGE